MVTFFSLIIIAIGVGAALFINFSLAKRPMASASLESAAVKGNAKVEKKSDLGFERSGRITYVAKKVGESVAEGEILAKIDDTEVLAQYAQAQSGVVVAQADLASLNNSLAKEKLKAKDLGSIDEKIQKKQVAFVENNIVAQKARILQAQDNVKNASIQLGKTVIKAPFAGTITRFDISLGEIVNPNVSVVTIEENNI